MNVVSIPVSTLLRVLWFINTLQTYYIINVANESILNVVEFEFQSSLSSISYINIPINQFCMIKKGFIVDVWTYFRLEMVWLYFQIILLY